MKKFLWLGESNSRLQRKKELKIRLAQINRYLYVNMDDRSGKILIWQLTLLFKFRGTNEIYC